MVYDKPIVIEVLDEDTEQWKEYLKLHAGVNKTSQKGYLKAGAEQSKRALTFTCRYNPCLEEVMEDTQLYRVIFRNRRYKLVDTDDYMLQHRQVKLIGESYG